MMESNVDFIKGLLEEALDHTDTQGRSEEELAEAASAMEALQEHAARIVADTRDLAHPPSTNMDTDAQTQPEHPLTTEDTPVNPPHSKKHRTSPPHPRKLETTLDTACPVNPE